MRYKIRIASELFRKEGLKSCIKVFFQVVWKQLLIFFMLPYAKSKIEQLNQDSNISLDELVKFTFRWCLGIIRPMQIQYEILELLKILNKTKPKSILEIGTSYGGTLFLFTRIASENAVIISIDLSGGLSGEGYSSLRRILYKYFPTTNQSLHLLRGDSGNKATLEEVETILNGSKIDLLFIDGDHRYESVERDFQLYSPLVKEKGVIVFHDIAIPKSDYGVRIFWDKIKSKYENIEIVKDCNQDWAGIGVIKYVKS